MEKEDIENLWSVELKLGAPGIEKEGNGWKIMANGIVIWICNGAPNRGNVNSMIKKTECAFALLGNNKKKSEKRKWYWGSKEQWLEIVKDLNKSGGTNNTYVTTIAEKDINNKEKNHYGIIRFTEGNPNNDKEKAKFIKRIREDLNMGEALVDKLKELIGAGIKQIICHGAPGTGKTYTVEEKLGKEYGKLADEKERINFVQFHPSYDYTDFVEGLRPVVVEIEGKVETHFVRMDGIFKHFCRKVVEENAKEENKSKNYIFIIDEINRADLAKVFGELMYLLEEGKRGEEHKIQTQYSNLPTYEVNKENEENKENKQNKGYKENKDW